MMRDQMNKTPVVAIVGPTASGKSALGLRVARALGGEIVCMDSMQVYKGLNIGTAKPTREEQALVPNHLLDIVEPKQAFSVAEYTTRAEAVLKGIWARNKLPVLVGGTGLYLKSLTGSLALGMVKGDEAIREKLHLLADTPGGKAKLHAMLREVDALSAARIHPNDLRRVVRALEVFQLTGRSISQQEAEADPASSFVFCLLGAVMERDKLYERVNRRVDEMMAAGLPQEVQGLLEQGISKESQAMQGIGYKELIPMLEGQVSKGDAVALLKQNTRRYAKRQWVWFRGEREIQWLDMLDSSAGDMALRIAEEFAAEKRMLNT